MSLNIPTAFIVRHGERLDHTDKLWQPDPSLGIWDPPITHQGFEQSEATGQAILNMMRQQNLDLNTTQVMIYTSPFQRCVDTSIGITKGLQTSSKMKTTLRLDLGLGEWMCERFFDQICPAQHLLSRQIEKLARLQAYAYSMKAKNQSNHHLLPDMTIDYAYTNPTLQEFDFPERYTDMIHRFEETRLQCLTAHKQPTVVIFVTHAVGVNALLDGFRNKVTIPLESNYCSISCVRYNSMHHLDPLDISDQSDEDCEYMENTSPKLKWTIDTVMNDTHLCS